MKKGVKKRNVVQQVMDRQSNVVGLMCRMKNDSLMKPVTFGVMNGTSKVRRPRRR